jgi:hydroxymethylpyrimidine/phosphomethylpyrimidine kinase
MQQHHQTSIPVVLTIAGSDSGGGAGIQADIKAISATGSYACSVITALTAQNTLGVHDICPVPVQHIGQQLDAVFTDLEIVAAKVGMLAETEIIHTVAAKLRHYRPRYLVVDPVMVSTSGATLLEKQAIHTLKEQLFPLADLITPNLPEAALLTEQAIPDQPQQIPGMIEKLRSLNGQAILLKGGHMEKEKNCEDWLICSGAVKRFDGRRIHTSNTHGTGCTLSAAIASFLAQGEDLTQAVQKAKDYLSGALLNADRLSIGHGPGPVHHFYRYY